MILSLKKIKNTRLMQFYWKGVGGSKTFNIEISNRLPNENLLRAKLGNLQNRNF